MVVWQSADFFLSVSPLRVTKSFLGQVRPMTWPAVSTINVSNADVSSSFVYTDVIQHGKMNVMCLKCYRLDSDPVTSFVDSWWSVRGIFRLFSSVCCAGRQQLIVQFEWRLRAEKPCFHSDFDLSLSKIWVGRNTASMLLPSLLRRLMRSQHSRADSEWHFESFLFSSSYINDSLPMGICVKATAVSSCLMMTVLLTVQFSELMHNSLRAVLSMMSAFLTKVSIDVSCSLSITISQTAEKGRCGSCSIWWETTNAQTVWVSQVIPKLGRSCPPAPGCWVRVRDMV